MLDWLINLSVTLRMAGVLLIVALIAAYKLTRRR